jgi:toxin FitB
VSYLLDTNAVSEIRKGARGDPQVAEWLASVDAEELHLSVITLGELRRGIDAVERRDRAAALALNRWYRRLVTVYEHRILVVDLRVVEEWGRITANASLPVADALIAATARVHGLTVVTRDAKDMERTGVPCLNPFAAH